MPRTTQEQKSLLGMAGEFLVAAELNRRGIHAAVTYGSSKSADVYAFQMDANRSARIEVKSTPSGSKKWLVGHKATLPENWRPNVFYVLVLLPPPAVRDSAKTNEVRGLHAPRFFVLTSAELGHLLLEEHTRYLEGYRLRHKKEFAAKGVPQLPIKLAEIHEDRWEKIEKATR